MMTSDEWTRAMFVHDSKERALSGFLMWRPKWVTNPKMIHKAKLGLLNKFVSMNGRLANCCEVMAH